MALLGKLISLAKSPQGRKLLSQAQKVARDPQNRERFQEVRSRFRDGKSAPPPDHQTVAAREDENGPLGRDEAPRSEQGRRPDTY